MVSTDASNKRIVKLFPSVACPLPTIVTEKTVGFPSAEQYDCGLHCHRFKKDLQLLLAKETGDFCWVLRFSFGGWEVNMELNYNFSPCALIFLFVRFFFAVCF